MTKKTLHVVLITPSRYDRDGYVLQWKKPVMITQAAAVLAGLLENYDKHAVLGEDWRVTHETHFETFGPPPFDAIITRLKAADKAIVCLTGALSSQFPRAMDIADEFLPHNIPVAVGGNHVNGIMAMFDDFSWGLKEAMDKGVVLFGGAAEGRLQIMLKDLIDGDLQPLYNYVGQPVPLKTAPMPRYPMDLVNNTLTGMVPIEASRGCPFRCTFCCIPNTQGSDMHARDPEMLVGYMGHLVNQGAKAFFFSDDNLCRNKQWPEVFDRLIAIRKELPRQKKFELLIEVDTVAYKIPDFVEKAARAGVTDVFIGLETIDPDTIRAAGKKHNPAADYKTMFDAWHTAGCVTISGFIVGFPGDTPQKIDKNATTMATQFPGEVISASVLTPLPGSVDHKRLVEEGRPPQADLNDYDMGHLVFDHDTMDDADLNRVHGTLKDRLYSWKRAWQIMCRSLSSPARPSNNVTILTMLMVGYRVGGTGPYDIGIARQRHRLRRRPGLPIEPAWIFYPKYWLKDGMLAVRAGLTIGALKVMARAAKWHVERQATRQPREAARRQPAE